MTLLMISTAALALTSCGSGAASGPAPNTSTPSTLTSSAAPAAPMSPADQAKQAALSAYRGMWADYAAAATTSDWQSPKLPQYATGSALSTISRGLYADHYNGLVSKGTPVLHPKVSSIQPPNDPTTVMITDCGDSTNWLQYKASNGQLADNSPGGRRLINATVQKQADGTWKVTDFGVHDLGSC
jgi:hypothetical protein